MATNWSDDIAIADLADEPALSDELNTLMDRVDACAPGEAPHVVLNFAQVTYVNSSTIAQMLRLRKGLQDAGRSLRLCAVGTEIWSVMQVTGLDRVFAFDPDPMTALAGLQLQQEEGS